MWHWLPLSRRRTRRRSANDERHAPATIPPVREWVKSTLSYNHVVGRRSAMAGMREERDALGGYIPALRCRRFAW